MDEKISISGIVTGLIAIAIFFVVTGSINTWGFTEAETVQTVLIVGFMALWGVNQAAKSIENALVQVGMYILTKYSVIPETPKLN
jgi:hypothetical protein